MGPNSLIPRLIKQRPKKLARLQRHLSRKVKGSKNWAKCLLKVQKLHQRVANIRRDTIHKITTFLAKNHSQVVIEDLNVSGMLKIMVWRVLSLMLHL